MEAARGMDRGIARGGRPDHLYNGGVLYLQADCQERVAAEFEEVFMNTHVGSVQLIRPDPDQFHLHEIARGDGPEPGGRRRIHPRPAGVEIDLAGEGAAAGTP